MPDLKDPSRPDFPHGSSYGYNSGCRPSRYDCPASPTCAEAKAAAQRELRRAQGGRRSQHPDWPKTKQVQRRLRETIAKAGIDAVAERTGFSKHRIERTILRARTVIIDPALAEPVDHAWTYLVHGIDSLAPDFPHGTVTSYNSRCCRCQKCRNAQRVSQKKSRAGVKTAHSIVTVEGLAEHVRTLLTVAGPVPVARAASTAVSVVHRAHDGLNVRAGVARRLLATTRADVARTAQLRPSARAHHQLRTMWALGYPLHWIADQHPGLSYRRITYLKPDSYVFADLADAIAEVAARVGDSPATPAHGLTEKSIAQARANARRAGYYPPAFYDDNMRLAVSTLDNRWADINRRADDYLEAARLLAQGVSQSEVAHRFGNEGKWGERRAKPLGLTYDSDGTLNLAASAAVIRRVQEVYGAYLACDMGPVEACLTLGLMRAVDKRHPEAAAWAEKQQGKEAAA